MRLIIRNRWWITGWRGSALSMLTKPPAGPLPAGMIIRINLFCLLTGAQCCRSADAPDYSNGLYSVRWCETSRFHGTLCGPNRSGADNLPAGFFLPRKRLFQVDIFLHRQYRRGISVFGTGCGLSTGEAITSSWGSHRSPTVISAGSQMDGPQNHVLQFPHVTRPGIGH